MTATTPITTSFTAQSTAAEVVDGIDLTGRRVIVTGGASGIGVETARALADAGAEVTLAVRNLEAGARTAEDVTATTGNKQVLVAPLDLSDQGSVASFVAAWDGPLHILVNNAGIMASPEMRTPEGWEMQFATNHLGHFALTTGLHRALAAAGGARVVSVSSSAHLRSPVVFEDIHFRTRAYEPWSAYGQSKTANVLFAVEATERWANDGITANALMPGGIRTNLQRYVAQEELDRMVAQAGNGANLAWKTTEQGAATSVLVATSPLLEGIGGRYFEDCNEAGPNQPGVRGGVAAYALDPEAAARLWQVSVETLAS
jgi:NAD(P)-dependent dehydrogenase (short-subunit alcohol dehydrogenase family)